MKWLFAAARTPGRAFPALTASVGEYFDARWSESDVEGYANFLAPLLPLAHRSGDALLIEKTEALVNRMLRSPAMTPEAWQVFTTASRTLLGGGAWPDRGQGAAVLRRLGAAVDDDTA